MNRTCSCAGLFLAGNTELRMDDFDTTETHALASFTAVKDELICHSNSAEHANILPMARVKS